MATRPSTPLSLTDLVVLGLVAVEPRHGFAAARDLSADGPIGQVWSVHRPLVYRAIDHLVGAALIEPIRTEPGAQGPHRTVYRATPKGRRRYRQWLQTPVAHPRDARAELLVKFLFLSREGRALTPLARGQLDRFRPMTEGLQRTADESEGAERLIAVWRLETLEATNRMLAQVIADEGAAPTARRP